MNRFLQKANEIKIELKEKNVIPESVCHVVNDDKCYQGVGIEKTRDYTGTDDLMSGDVCYDLGEHYVGYLSFDLDGYGEVCDSPIKLKLFFAEIPFDFTYVSGNEPGWLSYSWIQEEIIHVDTIPAKVDLPRRYACRYVKIEVVAKNKRMTLQIKNVKFKAVSCAGFDYSIDCVEDKYKKLAEVSCRTMRDCMQLVYEDGPKRDRRLWLGDLRLQALTNYSVFKDTALFKKCMYLFAGLTNEDGSLSPCLYVNPEPINGDLHLCDYSLLFMVCLWDYYEFSGDDEFCRELFEVAYRQYEAFYERINPDGTIKKCDGWWTFVDWDEDSQTPREETMVAIGAYCLKSAIKMSEVLGYTDKAEDSKKYHKLLCECALREYYDAQKGLFAPRGIVSWNTNAFMILADVVSCEDGCRIMKALENDKTANKPVTPYVYHYIAEAYDYLDMTEERDNLIDYYWGSMIEKGADTFWEAYKPDDPFFSPYDDCLLNSACHAWSSTPMYFLNKSK